MDAPDSNGAIDWQLFSRALVEIQPTLDRFLRQVRRDIRSDVVRACYLLLSAEEQIQVMGRHVQLLWELPAN